MVLMESTIGYSHCPLVEIDGDARVIWMNGLAHERLRDHPGLVVAAGRLRARRRDRNTALRDAARWADRQLESQAPLNLMPDQARLVLLGEDDADGPLHCWVFLKDAKIVVSFDDADRITRCLATAAEAYRLSPAQARLARRLSEGDDLAAAAAALGVSVNTVRTQLQRIFDKTGVRSRAALIRALLGVDCPVQ